MNRELGQPVKIKLQICVYVEEAGCVTPHELAL